MAFDIIFRDGSVDVNTVLPERENPYPVNEYRVKWHVDRIGIYLAQEQTNALWIKDIAEINSLTDSTTGGSGVIAVPATLKEVYDIVRPFFFDVSTGAGLDAWLGLDGTKSLGALPISTSLDYNPANSQEILTDGIIHAYQNFYKGAADSGFTNEKDFTTIIGDTVYNDGLGIFPTNARIQSNYTQGVNVYNDIYDWVASDDSFTYFAEMFLSVEEGINPEAYLVIGSSGVDGNLRDYNSQLQQSIQSTEISRNSFDTAGINHNSRFVMFDNERTGIQRLDDFGGGNQLEQDCSFSGATSSFLERTSRFRHDDGTNPGEYHRLFIQDRLLELAYGVTGTTSSRLNYTDLGLDFNSNVRLRVDNTVATDGVLEYATDPKLNTSWGLRSVTDKQYVDDSIAGVSGVFTPTINSTNMVEVSQESDFGTVVGGNITLTTNTTYFIRGNVSCVNRLIADTEGIILYGWDRDKDGLTFTGTGDFITATDVNFELANIKLSSTNSTGGEVVLRATNFDAGLYNSGRLKILTIINCQFRNCFDVHVIKGFDLVDIQQTLFWYIKATTIGCQFQSVSKLQISSCEYVRWFDETTIPTPSGYALTPLVELLTGSGAIDGFGAVNISSSILHPQLTQQGLTISATSSTGFGTISGNTFINIGLTTGAVSNFDYNVQNAYIIQANQGLINANAKGTLSIVGNLNNLDTGTTNPQVLNEANVGGSFTNAPTFPVFNRVITSVPNCSFTYDNKNDGNFFVVVTGTVEMTGDGFIACRVRANGVAIPFSIGYPEIRQGRAQSFSFSVIGSAVVGDVFDVEFEAFTTAGVPQLNDILVREFVLNGYQF